MSTGSFGKPYKVELSDNLAPVITNGDMPFDYHEHDIVVVDLRVKSSYDSSPREKSISDGELDWWVKCSTGQINPRSRAMLSLRSEFDKMLNNGCVFVVYAQHKSVLNVKYGYLRYGRFERDSEWDIDDWNFLSILSSIETSLKAGTEVRQDTIERIVQPFFRSDSARNVYHCVINLVNLGKSKWGILATNKHDEIIALGIKPKEDVDGWIFIVPPPVDGASFLPEFIEKVVQTVAPNLFPFSEAAHWLPGSVYEMQEISDLQDKISETKAEAEKKVADLEDKIEDERERFSYLYDLIRETGTPLVKAVHTALETIGFEDVVNSDELVDPDGGEFGTLKEDLRIDCQSSPCLLVEVKGISNYPSDEDALQVWKYLAPRMREWDRTDVRGLSIINHQRHMEPLRRDEEPFRGDVVTNAKENACGLMTTWDLYRIVRSYLSNGWTHEQVRDLFYASGRVSSVPAHYRYIGTIAGYIENLSVLGIQVEENEFNLGDRLAFDLPTEFVEQEVDSLELENKKIKEAKIGTKVGIETILNKDQARKGVKVYLATPAIPPF